MHQALYRKYRPKTFSELVGQDAITAVLTQAVKDNKVSHAYLFCGSRGTGKTTSAKILAKAVNCEASVDGNPCGKCASCISIDKGTATDVVEMDAASNNGVENIRDIREEVIYTPANSKKRVYIIDEVHMLSISAFNALLKTLEEPPEHVIFILATTETHKVPATILSRCQRFDFSRIDSDDIVSRLDYIAKCEGVQLEKEAAYAIARQAEGGMRDAVSLFEVCMTGAPEKDSCKVITYDHAIKVLGVSDVAAIERTVEGILNKDAEAVFTELYSVYKSSSDVTVFISELIEYYRNLIVVKTCPEFAPKYLDLAKPTLECLKNTATRFSNERLLYHSAKLDEALNEMTRANSLKRIIAETTLLKLMDERLDMSSEALLARIEALESGVAVRMPDVGKPHNEHSSRKKSEETAKTETIGEEDKVSLTDSEKISDSKAEKKEVVNKENSDDTSKREFVRLESFTKAVRSYEDLDPPTAAFLKMAKAYKCKSDNRIYIDMADGFGKMMFDNEEKKGIMARILSALENVEYTPSDIVVRFEVKNENTDDNFGLSL